MTFPEGESEELVTAHLMDIKGALIDIMGTVEYYKRRCRDTFPYCSTLFSCGASVIEAPRGEIHRVFTLEGACCPVFYEWVPDFDQFLNWLNYNRVPWESPANEDMPPLPTGFKFSEPSLDKGARANWGKWTLHDSRIYVANRIESSETLVVQYRGIKRNWKADDIMPYDDAETGDAADMGTELKRAVASFLRAEHLRKFERDERGFALERAVYDSLVAELKYTDWKERTPKPQSAQPEKQYPQLLVAGEDTCRDAECATPEGSLSGYFALIGDWGRISGGGNAAGVQSLVEGWSPDFIVTMGDNRYGVTYEALFAVLTYYAGFVERGMMFPGVGNHDTDEGGGIDEFLETFDYLPSGGRNYDIQLGNVHFFFRETHDTGTNSPTAAELAISAAQLRVRLAASQAPWKIVVTQDPPYVSDASNGNGHAASRLDYLGWGADLVVSGDSHFYERLAPDDYPPCIVNGGGGTTLDTPTTPLASSQLIYAASNGAIKGSATCNKLTLTYYNVAGDEIDSLELTK